MLNNSGPGETEKWIIAERESQFGRPERCVEQQPREAARGVLNNWGNPGARERPGEGRKVNYSLEGVTFRLPREVC